MIIPSLFLHFKAFKWAACSIASIQSNFVFRILLQLRHHNVFTGNGGRGRHSLAGSYELHASLYI